MKELETAGMLKGSLKADQQFTLITGCTDLKEALKDAIYVQVSP